VKKEGCPCLLKAVIYYDKLVENTLRQNIDPETFFGSGKRKE